MKFKHLSMPLALSLAPASALVSASCGVNNRDLTANWDIELNPQIKSVQNSVFKAQISGHADGDTVEFIALESKPKIGIEEGQTYRLRIHGIDTPEKAVGGVPAGENEQFWARKASDFASEQLKDRQIIYVFSSGDRDAYKRVVGDVFYKPGTDVGQINEPMRSYGVEITRAGWTLPYTGDANKLIASMSIPYTLEYYTYYMLGVALKAAYDNKRGFYGSGWLRKSPYDFAKIYQKKPIGSSWLPFWAYDSESYTNSKYVFYYGERVYKADGHYE
ncbi:thermonuclease family protein [Mycoplasma simbae]|uniref:thermonuclease family protein n=1 Tax=Mycoplasma simbae TaxID=36744 RepID=UPI000498653D|nr:thermonuclease family protein [Mycoplasma simbae]